MHGDSKIYTSISILRLFLLYAPNLFLAPTGKINLDGFQVFLRQIFKSKLLTFNLTITPLTSLCQVITSLFNQSLKADLVCVTLSFLSNSH